MWTGCHVISNDNLSWEVITTQRSYTSICNGEHIVYLDVTGSSAAELYKSAHNRLGAGRVIKHSGRAKIKWTFFVVSFSLVVLQHLGTLTF